MTWRAQPPRTRILFELSSGATVDVVLPPQCTPDDLEEVSEWLATIKPISRSGTTDVVGEPSGEKP